LGLIDQVLHGLFRGVSKVRNQYLHTIGPDEATAKTDALQCYRNVVKIALTVLGVEVTPERGFGLNPEVLRFVHEADEAECEKET